MTDDMLDDLYEDPQDPKEEHEFPCCPFLQERCARVHDFLRFSIWKGRRRKPGKVSITTDNGLWIVSITDVDYRRSSTVTGNDSLQCLETLDQLICTKQLYWRYWGNEDPQKSKVKIGTKR